MPDCPSEAAGPVRDSGP